LDFADAIGAPPAEDSPNPFFDDPSVGFSAKAGKTNNMKTPSFDPELANLKLALTAAMQAHDNLLAGHAAVSAPAREIDAPPPAKPERWSLVGSRWPRVGGRNFLFPPRNLFTSDTYKERYWLPPGAVARGIVQKDFRYQYI
jgi:hypothetical protein